MDYDHADEILTSMGYAFLIPQNAGKNCIKKEEVGKAL
jgi:hypothetical protein